MASSCASCSSDRGRAVLRATRRRRVAAVVAVAAAVASAQDVEIAAPEAITIVPRQTRLYADVTPTLRIQGTGFNGDGKNLHLEFVPKLPKDAYSVTVQSDTALSVQLKGKNRWPRLAGTVDATTMYLSSLKNDLNDDPEAELVGDSGVPVAAILGTPSIVRRDDRLVYMTGTRILNINGTHLRPKETTFVFDPPLFKDLDYAMQVNADGSVAQLTLKMGRKWRSDGTPGPLKIKRLNTGAGELRIDAKYGGVTVAEVQADLGAHGVTVETTVETRAYQSSPKVSILGNGFNNSGAPGANTLRWGNSLRGRGVNYTIVSAEKNQLVLELAPGSKWRANPANLPGPLTLLAVNSGAGPIPVGATEAKKGRQIATIYADPKIVTNASTTALYRTLSHELWLVGEGFVSGSTSIKLRARATASGATTPLRALVDYVLVAFNSTHARIWVQDGKAWAPEPDSVLEVTELDTGAGPFPGISDDAPLAVATVKADAEQASATTITRTLTTQTLYETPAKKSLLIEGDKLCDTGKVVTPADVAVVFEPAVAQASTFTVDSVKASKMTLSLKKNAKWPVGALKVVSIQCAAKADPVVFAGGEGVAVANVLPNPTVEAHEDLTLYAHHSRRLVIRGAGFSVEGTTLTFDPPPAEGTTPYKVVECLEDFIALELTDAAARDDAAAPVAPEDDARASWIPAALLPAKDAAAGVPLKVVAIDTGAGEVAFAGAAAITVATVVDEPEGDICDDSCEWANDGVCDDGTQPFMLDDDAFRGSSSGSYGRWGGHRPYDDDLGGFRYDDDDDIYGYADEYGYGFYFDRGYDDYGSGWMRTWDARADDDAASLAACPLGTDCTDCQPRGGDGRRKEAPDATCDNTCVYARDGYCDDGRDNMPAYCDSGTDCQDCGPVGADNFTKYDDEFWDDDGENFYFQDDYWDDYDRQYFRDDDYYGYYDDLEPRAALGGNDTEAAAAAAAGTTAAPPSKTDKKAASKSSAYLDDDAGPVKGYVRSQANPFEIDPAVASAGDDSLASLLLAGVFVAVLALAACGALRYAGPPKGKKGGLPCFNRKAKEDTAVAKDLAGAWADMTARRDNNEKSAAPVPITPDVHFSGASKD